MHGMGSERTTHHDAAVASTPTSPTALFRREGEYWTIKYEGTLVRLKDCKGLRLLAYLLFRPSERIAADDLARVADTQGTADAEHARVAVTKRIRSAIQKIGEHHEPLGYHLAATIKTGYQCSYLPDPSRPVGWRT